MGRNVLRTILDKIPDLSVTAIVRPGTKPSRYAEFAVQQPGMDPAISQSHAPVINYGLHSPNPIRVVEIDLADIVSLKDFLFTNDFNTVLHIGAIRGGRKFPKSIYLKSNVYATEQMVEYCLAKEARLIFCSSVGVFGAIPNELPANLLTEKNPDNYYHYTKIEAERTINKAVLYGLQAAIVRPSITYGTGDYGFPYQLVKMVNHHYFPLINKRIWIHLCHIDGLVKALSYLVEKQWESGITFAVADREPVQLKSLVDFISRQLQGKNYPSSLVIDRRFFSFGEKIARMMHNELWISRFELISKSWFYDVSTFHELLEKEGYLPHFTIPEFKITIEDYQKR